MSDVKKRKRDGETSSKSKKAATSTAVVSKLVRPAAYPPVIGMLPRKLDK